MKTTNQMWKNFWSDTSYGLITIDGENGWVSGRLFYCPISIPYLPIRRGNVYAPLMSEKKFVQKYG